VAGKYCFPLKFPVSIPGLRVEGTLMGTSILSFRDSVFVWHKDRIREGEEGRYWLWFIPNESYILIDYDDLISETSNGMSQQRFG